MSIHRRYEWSHRGHRLYWEQEWSEDDLRHVESLPHDVRYDENYSFYVENEPFESEIDDLLENILSMTNDRLSFRSRKEALDCMVSFVQHLNYYKERGEYPRYPSETLMDKGGDCEDTAILMAYISKKLGYPCAFLHFSSDGFMGIGGWGHCDLGIAPDDDEGEFSGSYWRGDDGTKYYYVACNGTGWSIGEYDGKYGHHARVYPVE